MDIILIGMQGAGKGTLSQALVEKYHFSLFETGAELRHLASLDSELGKKIKSIIEAGHLVPEEVVMDIIENFLKNTNKKQTIIFDGIPRNLKQAELFEKLLQKNNRNFLCVAINLSEETALKRLVTRRLCKKCKTVFPANYSKNRCEKCEGELITRADDNAEAIKTRIKTFSTETLPIIENYRHEGRKIIELNGEPSIEEVTREAFEKISPLFA